MEKGDINISNFISFSSASIFSNYFFTYYYDIIKLDTGIFKRKDYLGKFNMYLIIILFIIFLNINRNGQINA